MESIFTLNKSCGFLLKTHKELPDKWQKVISNKSEYIIKLNEISHCFEVLIKAFPIPASRTWAGHLFRAITALARLGQLRFGGRSEIYSYN